MEKRANNRLPWIIITALITALLVLVGFVKADMDRELGTKADKDVIEQIDQRMQNIEDDVREIRRHLLGSP